MTKLIEKVEEFVLSSSIILMAILLIISVIMRTVFNNSLSFSEELGQLLLIITSFFGLGYCARKAKHISMSIIFDRLNDNNKKRIMYMVQIISTLIMIMLFIFSCQYLYSVYIFHRVTPALEIPIWIFYLPVPIGFLLSTIEYIKAIIINVKNKEVFVSSEVEYSECEAEDIL